jgi:hypothetical protein
MTRRYIDPLSLNQSIANAKRFVNKAPGSDERLAELVAQARDDGFTDQEIAAELGTSTQRIWRVMGEAD